MSKTYSKSSNQWYRFAFWVFLLGVIGAGSLAYWPNALDRTLVPRLWMALLGGGLVVISLLLARDTPRWTLGWPEGLLLGYFLWQLQSCFWATAFAEALLEVQRTGLALLVFLFARYFLKADSEIWQQWGRLAIGLSWVGVAIALYQFAQLEAYDKQALYQIKGLSGHRNLFGALLLLLSGHALLQWRVERGRWKHLASVTVILNLLLLLSLQIRSAWVGLLVSGVVFGGLYFWSAKRLLWRRLLRPLLILGGVFGIALLIASATGLLDTFWQQLDISRYSQSETAIERFRLWDKTWCTIGKHPWLGVGAGNWQIHFPDCGVHGLYSIELNQVTFQRPHNDWLWVLAEGGGLGLGLYLAFWGSVLYAGVRRIMKASNLEESWLQMVRLSLLTGLGVIALFSFPKERPELLIWTYLLLASTAGAGNRQWSMPTSIAKTGLIALLLGIIFSLFSLQSRLRGEYHTNAAYAWRNLGQWDRLLASARQAESPFYTHDPTTIPMAWYEGTARFAQGDVEGAEQAFRRASALSPFNQHVWNDLASCQEKLGRREQAKTYYLEALRISPLFDDPRLNMAIISYKEQDLEKALHYIGGLQDSIRAAPYRKIIEEALLQKQQKE